MIYRYFAREGQVAEQRRRELLDEVARQYAIREARGPAQIEQRPFAAPGSFLIVLKRHFASGRFRPTVARPGVAPSQ